MISEKMVKALTRQMNREFYSGYLYLGMATYAGSIGLRGFEVWFGAQTKEETQHAFKFYAYMSEAGARVALDDVEKPPQEFSSAVDLFEKTLAHEKKVTQMIHDLVEMAKAEKDKETEKFLQWFVKEQIEEEATPSAILQKLKRELEKRGEAGLKAVDSDLGKRMVGGI